MLGTRPDIVFAVQQLSQFNADPSITHLTEAKRVIQYLQGSKSLGITYSKGELHGYTDSDFAGDVDNAKSTGGYVFLMGSGAVSWSSKKQSTVATSTTHAEYIAGFEAAREAAWLQLLLDNIKVTGIPIPSEKPITIYEPGESLKNQAYPRQIHYLRQQSEAGEIQLIQCGTNDMTADILTKALPPEKHERFVKAMGMETWKLLR